MKKLIFIFAFILCFIGGYAQEEGAKWRINLSGGIGYDIEDTSEDEQSMIDMGFDSKKVKDLVNDFKLGMQGSGDIHYLLNKNWGVGLKYIFYTNKGEISETKTLPLVSGYGNIELNITETDYLNYVGPSIHVRTSTGIPNLAISATFSGGYTYLRSQMKYLGVKSGFSGNSSNEVLPVIAHRGRFGGYAELGLEYFLTEKLSLGFDFGYFYTSFDKMYYKTYLYGDPVEYDIKLDKLAIISRLDFSLGIKIYL
jgi:hypothetical protein